MVGVIRGYPKTQEDWQARSDLMRQQVRLYNAEGITGRNGVRDGWGRKKKLINEIQTKAKAEAKAVVEKMIGTGTFTPDNEQAAYALEEAVAIIAAEKFTPESQPVPLYDVKDRMKAMELVLRYTQKTPMTRQEMAVTKAEDFLAALASKE